MYWCFRAARPLPNFAFASHPLRWLAGVCNDFPLVQSTRWVVLLQLLVVLVLDLELSANLPSWPVRIPTPASVLGFPLPTNLDDCSRLPTVTTGSPITAAPRAPPCRYSVPFFPQPLSSNNGFPDIFCAALVFLEQHAHRNVPRFLPCTSSDSFDVGDTVSRETGDRFQPLS